MDQTQREAIFHYAQRTGIFPLEYDEVEVRKQFSERVPQDLTASFDDPLGYAMLTSLTTPRTFSKERLQLSVDARATLFNVAKPRQDFFKTGWKHSKLRPLRRRKTEVPLLKYDVESDLILLRRRARDNCENRLHFFPRWRQEADYDRSLKWSFEMQDLPQQIKSCLWHEKLLIGKASLRLISQVISSSQLPQVEMAQHKFAEQGNLDRTRYPSPPLLSSQLDDRAKKSGGKDRCIDILQKDLLEAERELWDNLSGALVSDATKQNLSANPDRAQSGMNQLPRHGCSRAGNDSIMSETDPRKQCRYKVIHSRPSNTSSAAWTETGPTTSKDLPVQSVERSTFKTAHSIKFEDLVGAQMLENATNPSTTSRNAMMSNVSKVYAPIPYVAFIVTRTPWEYDNKSKAREKELQELTLPIAKLSLHRWSALSKIDKRVSWAVPFATGPTAAAVRDGFRRHVYVGTRLTEATELALAFRQLYSASEHSSMRPSRSNASWEEANALIPGTTAASLTRLDNDGQRRPYEGKLTAVHGMVQKRKLFTLTDLPTLRSKTIQHIKRATPLGRSQTASPEPPTSSSSLSQGRRSRSPVTASVSTFDVSGELSRFMNLRGQRSTPNLSPPRLDLVELESGPARNQIEPQCSPDRVQVATAAYEPDTVAQVMLSHPPKPSRTLRLVELSSEMFKNHALLRALNRIAPDVDLTERQDQRPALDQRAMGKASPFFARSHRSIIKPAILADATLRGGAGVLLTTLSSTIQRPPPGSLVRDPLLHQRIRSVIQSKMYKELHILVRVRGESGTVAVVGEKERRGLEVLKAFARSLARIADVLVHGVPDEEEDVARWIVGLAQSDGGKRRDILNLNVGST